MGEREKERGASVRYQGGVMSHENTRGGGMARVVDGPVYAFAAARENRVGSEPRSLYGRIFRRPP